MKPNLKLFFFSLSSYTPRGRLLRKSNSNSSTLPPRWVMVVSKPRRTKWPSWDLSRRTPPRQRLLPKPKHLVMLLLLENKKIP
jgi:hypothetical protein